MTLGSPIGNARIAGVIKRGVAAAADADHPGDPAGRVLAAEEAPSRASLIAVIASPRSPPTARRAARPSWDGKPRLPCDVDIGHDDRRSHRADVDGHDGNPCRAKPLGHVGQLVPLRVHRGDGVDRGSMRQAPSFSGVRLTVATSSPGISISSAGIQTTLPSRQTTIGFPSRFCRSSVLIHGLAVGSLNGGTVEHDRPHVLGFLRAHR